MSYRFMRMLLFYDLPNVSSADRHEYTRFHKFLIRNGFIQMQESVYCKLALNSTAVARIEQLIRANQPEAGLVQLLTITEKQFNRIEFIVGEKKTDIIDSDERTVIL